MATSEGPTGQPATNELAPVGSDRGGSQGLASGGTVGRSSARRTWGLVGQYAVLVLLSALVLGPILLILIQALSFLPAFIKQDTPLHPVSVAWKDRTWWSGGLVSVGARSVAMALYLAWLQKVGTDGAWRDRAWLLAPSRLVAVLGGTVVLGLATGPVFASLRDADGSTLAWWLLAALLVAATQIWGLVDGASARPVGAVATAVLGALFATTAAVVVAGPEVWTQAWTRFNIGGGMGRSLVMAVCITVAQVVTSILAAYAFVFLRFPFKRILFALFMATLLLPLEVTLVGNIAAIRQLEWTNTYQALVLPFGASALGTFLIRQGFRGLPSEIGDATRLDGYGHLSFMTKFAVPLTRPVIAAFTVISALQAWNQYLWPRTVTTRNSFNTLQIQLRAASGVEPNTANQAIAAALLAAVPVIILLLLFQRQIIRGLTAGAVK